MLNMGAFGESRTKNRKRKLAMLRHRTLHLLLLSGELSLMTPHVNGRDHLADLTKRGWFQVAFIDVA